MVAPEFFDSWEDGTFDKWTIWTQNPFVISTDPVKCGSKATITTQWGDIYHTLTATPDIQHFQFFFRIVPDPNEPPTGATGAIEFRVEFTDNTFIQLYVMTGIHPTRPVLRICTDFGDHKCTGATPLLSNQWYCIEIRIETNKDGATQQLYIDGDLECEFVVDLPERNFYRAYFNGVMWTNCTTAVDCYSYYDEDTYLNCLCTDCSEEGSKGEPADVTIVNEGGELTFEPIRWKERQICNPTIQDVPTRDEGQRINTDVWVLKTRELRIRVRLSDEEKTEWLNIFNSFTMCTITADSDGDGAIEWTYRAWFRSKKIVWDYREFGRCDEIDTRPWRADLIFDVESFSLDPYSCPAGAGTVKLHNHVLDSGIECDKDTPDLLSYIIDTDFTEVKTTHKPDWVARAVEVDEGHYNRRLYEITYVIRATDDLKYCLDLILQGHTPRTLVDTRYAISGDVWMVELEATWAGNKNWANPWTVQITLIADYNDLTIAEYSP